MARYAWLVALLVPLCGCDVDRAYCERVVTCADEEDTADLDDDALEVCFAEQQGYREVAAANEEDDCRDAITKRDQYHWCLLGISDCDDFLEEASGLSDECEDEREDYQEALNDASNDCTATTLNSPDVDGGGLS